jgi:hypothetical protein
MQKRGLVRNSVKPAAVPLDLARGAPAATALGRLAPGQKACEPAKAAQSKLSGARLCR